MKHLKDEFDKLSFKDTLLYSIAILSLLAGFTLLFMSMFIPPEGEIHNSVLTAFGIVLIFVGALLGINMKYESSTITFQKTILDMLRDIIPEPPKKTQCAEVESKEEGS